MTASVTVLQSEPRSPARWISCGPATHRPSGDTPRRARQAWLSAHRSCDGRPGTMRQRPRCARDLGSDAGCNEYSKTSHSLITSDKEIKTPKYHFASMRKYISVDIRLAAQMQFSDNRLRRERIAVGCCPLHGVLRDRGFEVRPFAPASLVNRGHGDQCTPLASLTQEVGLMS